MDRRTLKTLVSMALILSITCIPASLYSQNNRVSLDDSELLDVDFMTPTVTQTSAPTYTLTEAENLNRLYATWKAQLDALLSNIQHLAQLIDTNKIIPTNKYEARVWLGQLSALINQTTRLPYAPLTPHKLIRFFTFNKTLIRALTNAFNSNLTALPALEQLEGALEELTVALKTPTRTNLPISAVTAYAKETQQTTAALTYKIGNGGITWYNNVWRSMTSVNKNLHLWDVAVFTTGAATLASLTLMILPDGTFKDVPVIGTWKTGADNVKGALAPYVATDTAQGKSVALVERCIYTGSILYNLGLFTKLGQTWSDVDAFLKGTTNDSYQKFIQYVDDFTLEEQMFDSVRHLFEPFNAILKFLEDPDFYIRSNMKISKCILLSGTPGSGKTHSARALAGSINKLFAQLNRSEKAGFIEVEPWDLGQIEEVIKQAKANAPCVIFIDEFHLFGGGAQINTNAMWLSKLLTEIDKVDKANDPMQQIFIVAATNRPDLLAQALLRHGRFGERIEFPIPDLQQRTSVFKALCQKSAVDTTHIDLNHLAQLTQGASFSTISKIFERAGFIAKQHAQGITYNHLYQALNEVLRGLNARVNMSDSEKEIIAVHLAGIALAHLTLDTPAMLDAITLQMPRRKIVEGLEFMSKMENQDENKQHATHYGTFYTYNSYEHIVPFTADTFITSKLLLAGIMAQHVMLGGESSYGVSDRALAYEGAVSIALKGYKMDTLSKKEQNNVKDKAFAAIAQCEAELLKLFTEQKDLLRVIADELKSKEFLAVHEIKALITR
jgi:ATP-dependent Zn protease